jgi:hypothetical protein
MSEEKVEGNQVGKSVDWDKVKAFAFQAMTDIGVAMHGALTFIGDRLGIFKSMSGAGWLSSAELAARTRRRASFSCPPRTR